MGAGRPRRRREEFPPPQREGRTGAEEIDRPYSPRPHLHPTCGPRHRKEGGSERSTAQVPPQRQSSRPGVFVPHQHCIPQNPVTFTCAPAPITLTPPPIPIAPTVMPSDSAAFRTRSLLTTQPKTLPNGPRLETTSCFTYAVGGEGENMTQFPLFPLGLLCRPNPSAVTRGHPRVCPSHTTLTVR